MTRCLNVMLAFVGVATCSVDDLLQKMASADQAFAPGVYVTTSRCKILRSAEVTDPQPGDIFKELKVRLVETWGRPGWTLVGHPGWSPWLVLAETWGRPGWALLASWLVTGWCKAGAFVTVMGFRLLPERRLLWLSRKGSCRGSVVGGWVPFPGWVVICHEAIWSLELNDWGFRV